MSEQQHFVAIREGERGRIFDEAIRAISELGHVFRKAGTGKLVFAADGMWFTVSAAWLRHHLSKHIRFTKNGRPVDPPRWLVTTVLGIAHEPKIQVVDTSKPPPTRGAA
jgi:hypothetical protein